MRRTMIGADHRVNRVWLVLAVILALGLSVIGGLPILANGSSNCGEHPGAADPQDGSVTVCLPDESSERATSAINDNPGKAQSPQITDQLTAVALAEFDGIEFNQLLLSDADNEGHRIRVITGFTTLGFLLNPGTGNEYVRIQVLPGRQELLMQFVNRSNTQDFVFAPTDSLTIRFEDGRELALSINTPITVVKNDTPDIFFNFSNFWIDVNGNLYLNEKRFNELTFGPFTYEEAVANGAQ